MGTSPDIPASPEPAAKHPRVKKLKTPKSEFHQHPAVKEYRETLGFNAINTEQAKLIAQTVGERLETSPEDWSRFLRELAVTGNKHSHNVQVMVFAFERYRSGVFLSDALEMAWGQYKGRASPIALANGRQMLIDPNTLSPKTRGNAYALEEFINEGRKK